MNRQKQKRNAIVLSVLLVLQTFSSAFSAETCDREVLYTAKAIEIGQISEDIHGEEAAEGLKEDSENEAGQNTEEKNPETVLIEKNTKENEDFVSEGEGSENTVQGDVSEEDTSDEIVRKEGTGTEDNAFKETEESDLRTDRVPGSMDTISEANTTDKPYAADGADAESEAGTASGSDMTGKPYAADGADAESEAGTEPGADVTDKPYAEGEANTAGGADSLSEAEAAEESLEEEESVPDDAIFTDGFVPDVSWEYESYDSFAQVMTGQTLTRTGEHMTFYNSMVDAGCLAAGATIDTVFDASLTEDELLALNPLQQREEVPVYRGSDGNYYAVTVLGSINGCEVVDYQPATQYYNYLADRYTDIDYLGNGVFRIPEERFKNCYLEQYFTDESGGVIGITFGLRIQVLYGYDSASYPSSRLIRTEVTYPDGTKAVLPSLLDMTTGSASVKLYSDAFPYDMSGYPVTVSINKGESISASVSFDAQTNVLTYQSGDARCLGTAAVEIGFSSNITEEAAVPVFLDAAPLLSSAGQLYGGDAVLLDTEDVPADLKVGDRFLTDSALFMVGSDAVTLETGSVRTGALDIATRLAQMMCQYSIDWNATLNAKDWFLNNGLAAANGLLPNNMLQMTDTVVRQATLANGQAAAINGARIFGYLTQGIGSVTSTEGKVLNLEGTQLLFACMHAWHGLSVTGSEYLTIVNNIQNFTGNTTFAPDTGYGTYYPTIAFQCTEVVEQEEYTYATFKCVTSMLKIGNIQNAQNYQCGFSTLKIAWPSQRYGYVKARKVSADPDLTDGNSCYDFSGIRIGLYTDPACEEAAVDADGNAAVLITDTYGMTGTVCMKTGTYYVKEEEEGLRQKGWYYNSVPVEVTVTDSNTETLPALVTISNHPLNDPLGITIVKTDDNGNVVSGYDLSGAEFTIDYYAGQYSRENLPASPDYTWVVKTVEKKNGTLTQYRAGLTDESVVTGSAVYGKDAGGQYMLPLGTLTIRETKAPAGFAAETSKIRLASGDGSDAAAGTVLYNLNVSGASICVIAETGNSAEISDGIQVCVLEEYARGGIQIRKADARTGNTPQGEASFFGIRFAVINASGHDIERTDGTYAADGTIVQVVTADENGLAATGETDLPFGNYRIAELGEEDTAEIGKVLVRGASDRANAFYKVSFKEFTVSVAFQGMYTSLDVNGEELVFSDAQFIRMHTAAKVSETGAGYAGCAEEITLVDTVFYEHLDPSSSYTLKAELHDLLDGSAVFDSFGNAVAAEKTFTPEESGSGSVEVIFDSIRAEKGMGTVIFEYLYCKDELVFAHAELNDEDQQVYLAKISTTALADDTKDHITCASDLVSVTDTIRMEGLKPGNTYTIRGVLLHPEDGSPVTDHFGRAVSAEKTFQAAAFSETQKITFSFDGSDLDGTSAVAAVTLWYNGIEAGSHTDWSDADETVRFPSIRTSLKDTVYEEDHTLASEKTILEDTVTYTGLIADGSHTYTVSGYLVDKLTGEPLLENGKKIEGSAVFTPETSDGSVVVTFAFNSSLLKGTALTAFETCSYNGVSVAVHADLTDENQDDFIPDISTTLTDSETKDHISEADTEITLTDRVDYAGLKPETSYTVKGILYDKETGEPMKDDAGETITAEATFTTPAADAGNVSVSGAAEITFTFSGVSLAGKTTVAFETLYHNEKEAAVHADLASEPQSVHFPTIHTTASDSRTGGHIASVGTSGNLISSETTSAAESVMLNDTVAYENLVPGKKYRLYGTIMVRETGEILKDSDGNIVSSEKIFIAETADGSETMVFPAIDAELLAGKTLVIFEKLFFLESGSGGEEESGIEGGTKGGSEAKGGSGTEGGSGSEDGSSTEDGNSTEGENKPAGIEVSVHEDLSDEGQSVLVPGIRTSLKDTASGEDHTLASEKTVLEDTVTYAGLIADGSHTYTISGYLVDKLTGEPLLENGEKIEGSAVFTPETSDGSVVVTFAFNSSLLKGTALTAFETCSCNGVPVAVHADLTDENQDDFIPEISTTLIDSETKDHISEADTEITLIDRVDYAGLKPETSYTVKGILYDKETGEPMKDDAGETITAETTFTTPAADAGNVSVSGAAEITFTFSGVSLAGKTTVAFETLYHNEKEAAVHADLASEPQSVHFPAIHTTASDSRTGEHLASIGESLISIEASLTSSTEFLSSKGESSLSREEISGIGQTVLNDTVTYENLIPGKTYRLSGAVMIREDKDFSMNNSDPSALSGGEGIPATDSLGNPVTAEIIFTPKEADGNVTVSFSLDTFGFPGKTLVVFETLTFVNNATASSLETVIAIHKDLSDEGQSVCVPEIHTSLKDTASGEDHTLASEKTVLEDTVTYAGLIADGSHTYTISGYLVDKLTGEPLLENGEKIEGSAVFTPETSDGSVVVTFAFNSSLLKGTALTAFETCSCNGVPVAVHADLTDENQDDFIPEISTTLIDSETKDHISEADTEITLIDRVDYAGLKPETSYTVKGILYDKETGEPMKDDAGETITAEATFTTPAADAGNVSVSGAAEITFTFSGVSLAGKTTVAFETLYHNEKEAAVHADLASEPQSVHFPTIHTTASDSVTGNHTVHMDQAVVLQDAVSYFNLIPGKIYHLYGTVMVKESGEILKNADGSPVSAEKIFTAETAEGIEILNFPEMNTADFTGKTFIIFEKLVLIQGEREVEVGKHEDLNDENQSAVVPLIRTMAANGADGSKTLPASSAVTVIDTVTYTGLTPGVTYTVRGEIRNRTKGTETGLISEISFIPQSLDGSVQVPFSFRTEDYEKCELVVWESVYDADGNLIAVHRDSDDADQIVMIPESIIPEKPPVVVTGDTSDSTFWLFLSLGSLCAAAIVLAAEKRRKHSENLKNYKKGHE